MGNMPKKSDPTYASTVSGKSGTRTGQAYEDGNSINICSVFQKWCMVGPWRHTTIHYLRSERWLCLRVPTILNNTHNLSCKYVPSVSPANMESGWWRYGSSRNTWTEQSPFLYKCHMTARHSNSCIVKQCFQAWCSTRECTAMMPGCAQQPHVPGLPF